MIILKGIKKGYSTTQYDDDDFYESIFICDEYP